MLFRSGFEFKYNSLDHGYKMIGNAVPTKFASLIAKQISKDMKRLDNVEVSFKKLGKIKEIL